VIVFATDSESSRHRWLPVLAGGGSAVQVVRGWPALVGEVVSPRVRLVVIDPALPGLRPDLLLALVNSLPRPPVLRTVDEPLGPIPAIPSRGASLSALLRRRGRCGATDELQRRLVHSGLGESAPVQMAAAASGRGALLFVGPRGTGKELHARLVHRMSDSPGPFVVLPPGAPWSPGVPTGTLYVESGHVRPDLAELASSAADAGWRLIVGARTRAEVPMATVLTLTALRDRPDAIVPLARHFAEHHARALGLPRRRYERRLLALMQAWSWPQNERELDRFVQMVVAGSTDPVLRLETLAPELRARLDPAEAAPSVSLKGFEDLVSERLAAVVRGWHAGGATDLHELVIGAAERALLRLVLARTHGNRKAAAQLLGLARNTLQSHLARLGVSAANE
jgi:two-component system nitrogen regulation response regulator GlnG